MANGKPIRSFMDLMIWQKSRKLVKLIYELTVYFPADERFGLTQQVPIPWSLRK